MAHILVGKKLEGIKIAKDRMAILFVTGQGDIKALCDAECCSHTWIQGIETPALGFPCNILDVCDLDMPDLGDMEDCEVVSYYGLKIVTDKGDIIIDYRNDSNGYYGGSLDFEDEYFYGGVYNQNVSNEEWEEAKESY